MVSKQRIRVVLLVLLLLCASGVAYSWATRPSRDSAPPADGVTVITAQGREYLGDTGRMVAFGRNGSVLAEHRRYTAYFDVDPVPGTARVVEYIGVDHLRPENCPDRYDERWCTKQYLLRTNLTTGETTMWTTHYARLHKMHDLNRINDTHVVVADIYRDSVHVVNLTSGTRTWTWKANQSYEFGVDGGTGPEGFTHINDVELVRNDWIMVSLRNLDRVAFIDPGRGVVRNWTIGCEDCYDIAENPAI